MTYGMSQYRVFTVLLAGLYFVAIAAARADEPSLSLNPSLAPKFPVVIHGPLTQILGDGATVYDRVFPRGLVITGRNVRVIRCIVFGGITIKPSATGFVISEDSLVPFP